MNTKAFSCSTTDFSDDKKEGFVMKKMFLAILVAAVLLCSVVPAMACNSQQFLSTTLVVAGPGWDLDVRVNARERPCIKAPIVATLEGGTKVEVNEFIFTDIDGRIWAEVWTGCKWAYVSMRYLQPQNGGSFFYTPVALEVFECPDDDSFVFSELLSDQLILVEEIILNEEGYWARTKADGQTGYVWLVVLEAAT